MKKHMLFGIGLLAAALLVSACAGPSAGDGQTQITADGQTEVEAVSLSGTSYFILNQSGGSGLSGDLLSIRSDIEQPQIGAVYQFVLEDAVAASYPGQAAAKSAELAAASSDVIRADLDLGLRVQAHLPVASHLIDVRTPAEYASGHLPGSVNISSTELAVRIADQAPNQNDIILLYCRSGNRSAQAAATLKEMGYKVVFDLGGITGYQGELA